MILYAIPKEKKIVALICDNMNHRPEKLIFTKPIFYGWNKKIFQDFIERVCSDCWSNEWYILWLFLMICISTIQMTLADQLFFFKNSSLSDSSARAPRKKFQQHHISQSRILIYHRLSLSTLKPLFLIAKWKKIKWTSQNALSS